MFCQRCLVTFQGREGEITDVITNNSEFFFAWATTPNHLALRNQNNGLYFHLSVFLVLKL